MTPEGTNTLFRVHGQYSKVEVYGFCDVFALGNRARGALSMDVLLQKLCQIIGLKYQGRCKSVIHTISLMGLWNCFVLDNITLLGVMLGWSKIFHRPRFSSTRL